MDRGAAARPSGGGDQIGGERQAGLTVEQVHLVERQDQAHYVTRPDPTIPTMS
jgi:hypothetical protein